MRIARETRLHYLLSYAVLGTVLPYISVFLRDAGLSKAQVGAAFAIWSLASVLSPVVLTFLADGRRRPDDAQRTGRDPRRLLALCSVIVAACLIALPAARGAVAIFTIWSVYCLAAMPMFPLQDRVHFSQQRRRQERGQAPMPYYLVRAWGTLGYMIPSIVLLPFLRAGMRLGTVIAIGGALAVLAAVQVELLEDPRGSCGAPADGEDPAAGAGAPTLRAAQALLRPPMLALSLAVLLISMTATVHAAFFPIYLTERLAVPEGWLGQVSNLAVFVEAMFIFACGRLVSRLGARQLLIVATAATALRFGIIAAAHDAWVAVATQVFHGLLILTTSVLPQALFDERASDHFRHSMQGVLTMFTAAGKSAASLAAGALATRTLTGVFIASAVMSAAATVLVLWGFHEKHPRSTAVPRALPLTPKRASQS